MSNTYWLFEIVSRPETGFSSFLLRTLYLILFRIKTSFLVSDFNFQNFQEFMSDEFGFCIQGQIV